MTLYILLISVSFNINYTCPVEINEPNNYSLPLLETVFIEPVEFENISLWVSAVKSGPFINRSCTAQDNLSYSLYLPASVKHRKTDDCPPEAARFLAEYTAPYHSESLPLTIFNGWQWEYTYNISQFDSVTYGLPARGGCWENCWESILNTSYGKIRVQWFTIESMDKYNSEQSNKPDESIIEVTTFFQMRIRDGYPQKRQL